MSKENEDDSKPKSGSPRKISDIVRKIPVDGDPSIPDNENRFDKNGDMYIHLTIDDSALVVRADGTIDMISHDLETSPDGYVGDVEDLNKTFSLVLALASALEDEDLYNRIFHNLNMTLMRRWDNVPDNVKDDIIAKRNETEEGRTDEERDEKKKRIDEFRSRMNKYKERFLEEEKKKMMDDLAEEADFREEYSDDFVNPSSKDNMMKKFEDHLEHMDKESRKEKPKIKKRKNNPLNKLRGVDWNPNDPTLKAHWKPWHADESPPLEDDEKDEESE